MLAFFHTSEPAYCRRAFLLCYKKRYFVLWEYTEHGIIGDFGYSLSKKKHDIFYLYNINKLELKRQGRLIGYWRHNLVAVTRKAMSAGIDVAHPPAGSVRCGACSQRDEHGNQRSNLVEGCKTMFALVLVLVLRDKYCGLKYGGLVPFW